ncbi:MAG: dicarboxylate/amino acid:cation symporter [Lachnospiraceae bacterium]|nr:dicarboxylate/amino acid:cation symporter [Lachnospiraceae bacterium]
MGTTINLKCSNDSIAEGLDFIRKALDERKVASKEAARTVLTSEEVLAKLISNAADPAEDIKIEVGGILGNVEVRFRARGTAFDAADIEKELLFEQEDEEANAVIRRLLDKILKDDIQIKNSSGVNTVAVRVKKSAYSSLVLTLIALVLGIATGLIMQSVLPADAAKGVSTNLFVPVYTVFMNALKMIVAPLVFFSIAASIADFGDIKALGRIAIKVVIMYICTSAIAICIGFFTYNLFPIGHTSLAAAVSEEAAADTLAKGEDVKISIKDTLVGVVPSDIVTPFQKSDMLQIIFMAVILGLAAAVLAKKYPLAKEILAVFNAIFSKITTVLVGFIPLIVFCSMAKMMINMNLADLANVILWVPVIYFGDLLMIIVYLLLLLIFAGLNPLTFLMKYYPAMVSAFTFASSNAALPSSLKQCDEMGVSPKVYSFSLPLGATINMDGNCISLMITALFFAKIFNIPASGSVLLSLFISIIVLSVGSPGVPGGNLVCIALLVPQIGIPAEAISLVMGLYPLMGMMQACTNVTGDAVVTTIVAKHEKLIDIEKFNQRR